MSGSLFAHLAFGFSTSPENLATEALCYVLGRSQTARDALGSLFARFDADVPAGLRWATQVGGGDGARPDLVGLDDTGNQPVVIEAKFWAGLTESQPLAYLQRPGVRALVFVAPATRSTHLWNELRRRCEALPFRERGPAFDGSSVARVGDATLVLVSWRDLLGALLHRVEAADDRATAADLMQLSALCDRMDAEAFLPVTSEELTTHVYRRVIEFGRMVDDVTGELVRLGLASKEGLRYAKGNGVYGRYLLLGNVGVMLACDIRKWQRYAAAPLWLSVYGARWEKSSPHPVRQALASLEARRPPKLHIAQDGFPAVPLFVPLGAERDDVIRAIVKQVVEVGDLLASIATAAEPSAAPDPDDGEEVG